MSEPDELHSGRGVTPTVRTILAAVMAVTIGSVIILGSMVWVTARFSPPEFNQWASDPVGFTVTALSDVVLYMVLNPWTFLFPLGLFAALAVYFHPGGGR